MLVNGRRSDGRGRIVDDDELIEVLRCGDRRFLAHIFIGGEAVAYIEDIRLSVCSDWAAQ